MEVVGAREADHQDRQLPGGAYLLLRLRSDDGRHRRRRVDGVRTGLRQAVVTPMPTAAPRAGGIVRPVATFDDVARLASELPDVTEGERHGHRTWFVGGKAFAWERPFSKADLRRFGEVTPPDGPIVALQVLDLADKAAVLAAHPESFFTIPHFDGYSAVLIHLRTVNKKALR